MAGDSADGFDEKTKQVINAVEEFCFKATVPILYGMEDGSADQFGTGTLFDIKDRVFLVTAAHVFEEGDLKNFSIPYNPRNTALDIPRLSASLRIFENRYSHSDSSNSISANIVSSPCLKEIGKN